jgi:Ras-related protein Rab-1A
MDFVHPELIFKISLLGKENIGKETLFNRFSKDPIPDYYGMMIRGVAFFSKDLELYGKSIRSTIWVFSLEDKFRKLFRYYINGSNGVILMYDITNKETLNNLSDWYQRTEDNLDGDLPILLVGNKLDLGENREVSEEEVEKFKKSYDISSSMEISVKTGENLEKMFMDITRMVLKR